MPMQWNDRRTPPGQLTDVQTSVDRSARATGWGRGVSSRTVTKATTGKRTLPPQTPRPKGDKPKALGKNNWPK